MLVNELSGNINHIKMQQEITEIMVGKNENVIFHAHFLTMDISSPISYKPFKFSACSHEGYIQGSLSQNFDLGLSFDSMKCNHFNIKK